MRRFRITNWSPYNASLIQRGNLNIWFSEDVIRGWRAKSQDKNGRPFVYSDDAILAILMMRTVFRLPLRALEGFLRSLIQMRGLDVPIPSYTQISRRAKGLKKTLKRLSQRLPTAIVFDSTGLKVYGEGEWKVRMQGTSKRRTWRKLHIAVDPRSMEVVVAELTDNKAADSPIAEKLLEKCPKSVERAYGDKAYDRFRLRRRLHNLGIEAISAPSNNAKMHRESSEGGVQERNRAIMQVEGLGGDELARRLWKKLKGYHTRSLVETTMYRFKQLMGDRLQSREWDRQYVEVHVKSFVLNKMTRLGMPKGVWEEAA